MNQTLRTKRLDMTLDDRLSAEDGWVYMTGMQALVRLPIQQHKRDQAAGLNTGGYISGYRGSPLGTFDLNLKRAESDLRAHNIHFQPGVNEDLAVTATWGAQMVGLAEKVMCDCLFANMLLVGAAWQQGAIPLSLKAIHRAIALNGAAIEKKRQAFDLGRLAMADPAALRALTGESKPVSLDAARKATLDELVARRLDELSAYGVPKIVETYRARMKAVGASALSDAAKQAVARGLYKLLAVKDAWEVARLYTKPSFRKSLDDTFDGDLELTFHFGAWPFDKIDPATGGPVKGPVKGKAALRAFALMNRFRFLRGTALDPFRNTGEAQLGRKLLTDYQDDIDFALAYGDKANDTKIVELLDLPEAIRGYGHVREVHAAKATAQRNQLKSAITSETATAA